MMHPARCVSICATCSSSHGLRANSLPLFRASAKGDSKGRQERLTAARAVGPLGTMRPARCVSSCAKCGTIQGLRAIRSVSSSPTSSLSLARYFAALCKGISRHFSADSQCTLKGIQDTWLPSAGQGTGLLVLHHVLFKLEDKQGS